MSKEMTDIRAEIAEMIEIYIDEELLDALEQFVVEQVAGVEPVEKIVERDYAWVKYIGRRPVYNHGKFGLWEAGAVKQAPRPLAEQMCKHPDMFVVPEPDEIPEHGERIGQVSDEPELTEQDNIQELRDQIMAFRTKADIIDLVKREYQIDIAGELANQGVKDPKMADLQQAALIKIDQYGLNT